MFSGGKQEAARWTRKQLLGVAGGGGALLGAGLLAGAARDGGALAAEPSRRRDADVLGLFLTLEYIQEALYRQALRAGGLGRDMRRFAAAAADQESEHVAFLRRRLRGRAPRRPQPDFGDATRDPDRFAQVAIDLEEAAIAAYVGQGANLTRDAVAAVAPMVSVEARQAAWIRDLAGVDPAPRAADPARSPDAVLGELRRRGYLR